MTNDLLQRAIDEQTPWLLFTPDGTWDGLIWSPKTIEQAQRMLARPRRWATLEREGWTVRKGKPGEHLRLLKEHYGEATPTKNHVPSGVSRGGI